MINRSQALEEAQQREFDLVVIGGGVAGAGVAQDAASRGLSVLIIEKDDFASGSSSRTTKLIDGGLRYLEQMQFGLTRELCQERGLLEQLAPHMVRDFSFVLPVVKDKKFFGLKAQLGLTIYDLLSINARGVRSHERLGKKAALQAAPSLSEEMISGALRFHDCITDDARLVLEIIKSATTRGAAAINYLEAKGFEQIDGQVRKVLVRDRLGGRELSFDCRSCVNATGVWSDILLEQIEPGWQKRSTPVKGTHIMLPLSAFETNNALFLPTPDGGYVFVVPWQKALMVGTTDNAYDGPLDNPQPNLEEIDYLLSVLNSYTRQRTIGRQLEREDIIAAWSGLRPLISGLADGTNSLSREHALFTGPGGLITIIGGQLTNYRLLAQQVVNTVTANLKKQTPGQYLSLSACRTAEMMLGGWQNKQDYLTSTAQIAAHGRKLGLDPATLVHITESYGKDALTVLDIVEASPHLAERICPDFPPIMAEAMFVIQHEMAISLEDILSRRIRLGFVHREQCLTAAPKVARLVAPTLLWDNARIAHELGHLAQNLSTYLTVVANG